MLFPKGETPVQITLYKNVPFSNDYSNHIFRPDGLKGINGLSYDTSHMVDFLEGYVQGETTQEYKFPHITLTDNFNFDYGNGILTSIVLEIPSEYTDSNYMYVYGQNGNIQYKFYFFIKSCTIMSSSGSNVTCKLELELDVLATYDNDILKGLDGVPLLTERKHCQRFSIGDEKTNFYCSDITNNESFLTGVKPNIIKKKYDTNIHINAYNGQNVQALKGINWFYMFTDGGSDEPYSTANLKPNRTTIRNKTLPNLMCCYPDVDIVYLKFKSSSIDSSFTLYSGAFFNKAFGSTYCYSLKVSPYPPFASVFNTPITNDVIFEIGTNEYGKTLTITIKDSNIKKIQFQDTNTFIWFYIGNNLFYFTTANTPSLYGIPNAITIQQQNETIHFFDDFTNLTYGTEKEISQTSIKSEKYEPKLNFFPCKKYLEKAQYSDDGLELHPELVCSKMKIDDVISLFCVSSCWVDDLGMSYYNVIGSDITEENPSYLYQDINYGLSCYPNYTIPVSTNAIQSFYETQSGKFNANLISKVVGGALTIMGGATNASLGTNVKGNKGLGMQVGGVQQAVTGLYDIGTTLGNMVGSQYDLQRTADTISTTSSDYYHDVATGNSLVPYIVEYELTPSEKQNILDYFYHYGYNVGRSCYLNSSLKASDYTDYNWVDTRLLTRSNFNYIKLGEDITNKIDTPNIPYVCKQKIANIFKNGITLWTLFNSDITEGYSYDDIEPYFLREKYENVEVDL